MPRGKAIWNANGGFVSVLLTHLLVFSFNFRVCEIHYDVFICCLSWIICAVDCFDSCCVLWIFDARDDKVATLSFYIDISACATLDPLCVCVCVTGSCTVRWENKTMYCIVSVFGLAFWLAGVCARYPMRLFYTFCFDCFESRGCGRVMIPVDCLRGFLCSIWVYFS